ncbi:MAG: histidine kinase dimerization/phospho-acceptor domain-containing protein [Gemmatimonadales bacterium]
MNDPDALVEDTERARDAAREVECLVTMGQMAGRVAHEINNPLASLQNAYLLIKDAIPASHPHYRYVAAIDRQIQRIATVTRVLSESYRPEQDRATGVAVAAIVADVIRIATVADGVEILVDNHCNAPFGQPAGLLRHALHQILALATRISDHTIPIQVTATGQSGRVRVEVRYREAADSEGVAAAHYPHRLVAAMNGTLDTAPAGPGECCVTLSVPMTGTVETSR